MEAARLQLLASLPRKAPSVSPCLCAWCGCVCTAGLSVSLPVCTVWVRVHGGLRVSTVCVSAQYVHVCVYTVLFSENFFDIVTGLTLGTMAMSHESLK